MLIIEENAEELGFAVKERVIERGEKYTLFTNPYLQECYSLKEHQKKVLHGYSIYIKVKQVGV